MTCRTEERVRKKRKVTKQERKETKRCESAGREIASHTTALQCKPCRIVYVDAFIRHFPMIACMCVCVCVNGERYFRHCKYAASRRLHTALSLSLPLLPFPHPMILSRPMPLLTPLCRSKNGDAHKRAEDSRTRPPSPE